jgi:nucleoredoxin
MAAFVEALGPKLLGKDGELDTVAALDGAVAVGLYFSAHWCPPCRGFTPKLAETFKKFEGLGKGFKVVFVSSDRDEEQFKSYFAEQPWLALPFENRDQKNALSKKYKVSGIPTLVILDGTTGEVITTDGRAAMADDPEGASFPWKPPTLWEALGEEVMRNDGESVDVSSLRGPGKVLGLYFSASWCPPCHAFTPKLVECYNALKAAGKDFEVVFVSSDKSMAEWQKYFESMPWLSIPQGDKRKEQLSKMFDVEGIPTFALVDAETGKTISANARGGVMSDPAGLEFPWYPKAVNDLAEPEGINEETALLLLLEGCTPEVQRAATDALTPIAEGLKQAGSELLFFTATSGEGATPQVRKLTNAGEPISTPQMILLDIPDKGGYYVSVDTEVTTATINAFLDGYKAKTLERKQLE